MRPKRQRSKLLAASQVTTMHRLRVCPDPAPFLGDSAMFNADQNMNDGDTREGTSPGDDRTGALGPCACCVALSQVLRDPCQSQERVAALTTVRRGKGQQLALLSRLAGWSGRGAAKKGQDKEGGPPDSREKGEASGMDAGNGSAESAPVVGTEQDDKSAV